MKQVVQTPEVVALMKAALGADINASDFAVFEAIALNSLPLRQKHPLFDGAVAKDSLLQGVVASVNAESVPLQVMHNMGSLPKGRVFHAKMNGQEARILFALSKTTDAELISKVDQGLTDQVSVNLLAKQVLCSDCGWDYLGEDASVSNVYLGVCANDHALRADGVHAELHGLSDLFEISLVGKGGARNARIVDRNSQMFASEDYQRLAASGHAPALLVADITPTNTKDDDEMDLTALVADLTTSKAANITLTADVASRDALILEADAALADAQAALAEAQAKVDELEAAAAAVEEPAAEAPEAVLSFLSDTYKRTQIALGDQAPVVPTDVNALIAGITAGQTKLSAIIPVDGVANGAANGEPTVLTYAPRAFQTAR